MAKKKTPAQRFADFFRLWIDSAAKQNERDEAKKQMNAWLKRHGKVDSDIPAILAQAAADDAAAAPPPPPSDPRDATPLEQHRADRMAVDAARRRLHRRQP